MDAFVLMLLQELPNHDSVIIHADGSFLPGTEADNSSSLTMHGKCKRAAVDVMSDDEGPAHKKLLEIL